MSLSFIIDLAELLARIISARDINADTYKGDGFRGFICTGAQEGSRWRAPDDHSDGARALITDPHTRRTTGDRRPEPRRTGFEESKSGAYYRHANRVDSETATDGLRSPKTAKLEFPTMSICTHCGLGPEYCTCTETVDFDSLSYAKDGYAVPDQLVRQLKSVKRRHGDALRAWEAICTASQTGSNVRKAHFWAVTSVQTRTELLDELTTDAVTNFKTLKNAVEQSTDGGVKWDKVQAVWTGDLADEVAESALAGDWIDVIATLTGHEAGYNARSSENYVRTVKANLIAEILGDDDALCLDSARRSVLEPLFEEMFHPRTSGTHLGTGAEFRGQAVPATSDPVFPGSKRFIEEWLAYNPREYRAITREILGRLSEETGMSKREVSHALFILGNQDGATAHESLAAMLD